MQPLKLLESAEILLGQQGQPTSDENLRRAWSSIYYSIFHFFCGQCADQIIGSTAPCRRQRAWNQVYRALDHGSAKQRCKQIVKENHVLNFPSAIKDAAALFITLQEKRHEADYDINKPTTTTDIRQYIEQVRQTITRFKRVPTKHRKAFAAILLINQRDKNK